MSNLKKEPLLKVQNLKMYFPIHTGLLRQKTTMVKAVDNISLEIYEGETFGLVGESGCGKTTAGKCILRILDPTEGSILFDGKDITRIGMRELDEIRRDIQLIFQDPYGSLDPRQSAFSMLKEVLDAGKRKFTAEQTRTRIEELLVTVGLNAEIAARYPHELSGGQRQRLGIARALACDPKLIVCDEPVSALDVSIQAQIINLFKMLQSELKLTYLFVAHDLAVVRHIANRIGVMYLGEIVEIMESEKLYQNPMHPYTQALLSAIPTTDYFAEQQRNRMILKGEVPSPMHKPSGCAFHPRCNYATDLCKAQRPTLQNMGDGHMVSCHHAPNNP